MLKIEKIEGIYDVTLRGEPEEQAKEWAVLTSSLLCNVPLSTLENFAPPGSVEAVDAMIQSRGNRSQRREALKALRKSENIRAWTEKEAQKAMRREINERADDDLIWLVATVADTLYEDYHWKESPENDHGQITAFLERFVKRMNRYAEEGYSTKKLVDMIEQKMGIELVPNKSWR